MKISGSLVALPTSLSATVASRVITASLVVSSPRRRAQQLPSPSRWSPSYGLSWWTPDPYQLAGLRRGTNAYQLQQLRGQRPLGPIALFGGWTALLWARIEAAPLAHAGRGATRGTGEREHRQFSGFGGHGAGTGTGAMELPGPISAHPFWTGRCAKRWVRKICAWSRKGGPACWWSSPL